MEANRERLRNAKHQLEELMRQVKQKHFELKNIDGLFQVQIIRGTNRAFFLYLTSSGILGPVLFNKD